MQSQLNWVAVYKDGTTHTQDELVNSEKIDRSQLSVFKLMDGEKLIFSAHFRCPKRKLIFRKRQFLDMTGQPKGTIYLVGWHENVKGVSIKSICYIYEDGHIEFADDRKNLELVPCEK